MSVCCAPEKPKQTALPDGTLTGSQQLYGNGAAMACREMHMSSLRSMLCQSCCVGLPCCDAGGHVISAVVGVCIRLALDKVQWLANAVGMSLALLAMQLTGTVHPPGGATALIACSAPVMFAWHGFQLVVAVMLGAVELLLVGLVVNNFHRKRAYPTFWW